MAPYSSKRLITNTPFESCSFIWPRQKPRFSVAAITVKSKLLHDNLFQLTASLTR
jgi:hypothetical protein